MVKILKAVILVAGKGLRLRPITAKTAKPLIPLAGKPLLDHTLNSLSLCGISECLLIVGHGSEDIINHYNTFDNPNLNFEFVVQEEQLGTAHAISLAEDFVGEDKFVVHNGDVLTPRSEFTALLNKVKQGSESNFWITGYSVEDSHNYGAMRLEKDKLLRIEEKSPNPPSKIINAGTLILNSQIFDAIRMTKPSSRGEFEVTDSINIISKEVNIFVHEISTWWIDVGRPWDLLRANTRLMDEIEANIEGKVEQGATLKGKVSIGTGTLVRSGTYIEGPVLIGKNSRIGPNCYIRPSTYIGKDVKIGNAVEIKNSIILDHTIVGHLSYVGDSFLGRNVNFGAGTKVANLKLRDKSTVKMQIREEWVDSGLRKLGVFIGDDVKTGINVSLMPGVKLGPDSAVGAHTLVLKDVPPNTLVFVDGKGSTKKRSW